MCAISMNAMNAPARCGKAGSGAAWWGNLYHDPINRRGSSGRLALAPQPENAGGRQHHAYVQRCWDPTPQRDGVYILLDLDASPEVLDILVEGFPTVVRKRQTLIEPFIVERVGEPATPDRL